MTTTFDRIGAMLLHDHHVPAERLVPEALLDDLGIDSLATVELLWSVEETFHVKLPTDADGLHTLGDVARCVDALLARRTDGSASGRHAA
ncbi:acyl carrier protein [Rubrivivax sp. RP6-9]|uniref:acyl carrier protein n=1 Tax=Rubrivivax sp. RP6-9 TaxID=3415750 RepID=UPI003CC694EE